MARNERGAAAVEFALVVPMLVLLLFGVVEFGRAYFVQTTVSGAAREGVRVMALQNNATAARAAAVSAASTLGVTSAQVTVSPASCVSTPDAAVSATVTVTYPMTYVTGLFGSSITLTGKGVMRCNG